MASRGVNKVILVGNLGQDPEVRYMPNGGAVANITLATSESWRDKATGEMKEQTEWHRVVLFGKLAEVASEYLRKGSQVYIEGQLRTRKWTDQSGQDRYREGDTDIHLELIGHLATLRAGSYDSRIGYERQVIAEHSAAHHDTQHKGVWHPRLVRYTDSYRGQGHDRAHRRTYRDGYEASG